MYDLNSISSHLKANGDSEEFFPLLKSSLKYFVKNLSSIGAILFIIVTVFNLGVYSEEIDNNFYKMISEGFPNFNMDLWLFRVNFTAGIVFLLGIFAIQIVIKIMWINEHEKLLDTLEKVSKKLEKLES